MDQKQKHFTYCDGKPSAIWGFMNKKTGEFHSPVNQKVGR